MNGWSVKDVNRFPAGTQTVGASVTAEPITLEFPISAGGATQGLVMKLKFITVTVTTGITAKFQHACASDWEDAKTVAITAGGTGCFYIRFNPNVAGDQAYIPLLNKGRIVLTTGTGDTATVEFIGVLQDL